MNHWVAWIPWDIRWSWGFWGQHLAFLWPLELLSLYIRQKYSAECLCAGLICVFSVSPITRYLPPEDFSHRALLTLWETYLQKFQEHSVQDWRPLQSCGNSSWRPRAVPGSGQQREQWQALSHPFPGLRPAGGAAAYSFWTLVTSQDNF